MRFVDDLDVVLEELDDLIQHRSDAILNGSAEDYATYRHHVGVLAGLRRARQSVVEARRSEDED